MAKYGTFLEYLNAQGQLTESSLSRLWRKYKNFESGTISACRHEATDKMNNLWTRQLKTDLIRLGYSVTEVAGSYIENYGTPDAHDVDERSFIVFDQHDVGNLKADLFRLGKKYHQDAITYSTRDGDYYLIGTKAGAYPGLGVEEKLGSPMFSKTGVFHSKVKGRPFVFESVVQGYYNFDCSQNNYSRTQHYGMFKHKDYILPE